MRQAWFILILLTVPRLSHAGRRGPDSLQVENYSFPNELWISSATFFLDSLNRNIQEIERSGFNTPYHQFNRQLDSHPGKYNFWIRLTIRNNTDSILHPYFYCGDLNYVDLYFISPGHPITIIQQGNLVGINRSNPYVEQVTLSLPLRVLPRQSGEILLKIRQTTAEYSFDNIQVYDRKLLYSLYGEHYEKNRYFIFFQILFMGFLLCQLLYALFQWAIIRYREYLYYFFYLLALTAYFFSKQEIYMGIDLFFSHYPTVSVYLNKALIILPYFLYFRFVRCFLEMNRYYPVLDKWVKYMEYFLLSYLLLDIILVSANFHLKLQAEIYMVVIGLTFLASVAFIAYLFTKRKTLIYYILTGSFFVGLGNFTGLLLTFLMDFEQVQFGLDSLLIFSQIGILIEIVCFTSGLSYKSKLNEVEKVKSQQKLIGQLKTNEKLRYDMQEIRNKMARDLHDDIGATLSTILLYSHAAKKKIPYMKQEEILNIINKISHSATQMIDEMNDIVWSINPKNDTMEKIIDRMRFFAFSLLSANDIRLSFQSDQTLICETISMNRRKNCYLIFKEALNNLMKYSDCTEVDISIVKNNNMLEMSISDNGKGFDMQRHREGNGLLNMSQRTNEMEGTLHIASAPGKGARIVFALPLG